MAQDEKTFPLATVAELETVVDELMAAAFFRHKDDAGFAAYMFRTLNEYIAFEAASLNLCIVKEQMQIPEIRCFFHRQPKVMERQYQRESGHDFFTPNLIRNLNSVMDVFDYISPAQFHEHPIYLHHCRDFDVDNVMAAAGKVPLHRDNYIILYLYASDHRLRFERSEIALLDFLFPILMCLWLVRLGFMDRATAREKIGLIRRFTRSPRMLKLIKLLVNQPMATSSEYAQALGVKKESVERQLEAIYQKLDIRGFGKNKRILLYRHFSILGD